MFPALASQLVPTRSKQFGLVCSLVCFLGFCIRHALEAMVTLCRRCQFACRGV